MYVCMYVCMYVFMYVCMHACMCVCMCVMYICIHLYRLYVCTSLSVLTCLSLSPVRRSSSGRICKVPRGSGDWTRHTRSSDSSSRAWKGYNGGGTPRILPRTTRSRRIRFHTPTAGSHHLARRTPRNTLSTTSYFVRINIINRTRKPLAVIASLA